MLLSQDILIIRIPDRGQSKTLILSTNVDKKSLETEFWLPFVASHCHLSPDWRQMAIKNTVSRDFWSVFVKRVLDCHLSGVIPVSKAICWAICPMLGYMSQASKYRVSLTLRPRKKIHQILKHRCIVLKVPASSIFLNQKKKKKKYSALKKFVISFRPCSSNV